MPELSLARATRAHLGAINNFLCGHNSANKRYENVNAEQILSREKCFFSAIYVQESDGSVYGLFASTCSSSKDGIASDSHDIHCFAADPVIQKTFLHQCMETLFKLVNELETVAYPPAPSIDLLELLKSVGFTKVDGSGGEKLICKRDIFVPRLLIRPASVEDSDQLLTLFRNNQMGDLLLNDYDISNFVESSSEIGDEICKALVAEVKGRVVGFLKTSNKVPVAKIAQRYHVEIFTSIGTIGRRVLKSMEMMSSLRELEPIDQVGLEVTDGVSVLGLNEIEALKQDNLEENVVDSKMNISTATSKVPSNRRSSKYSLKESTASKDFILITHFCIDSAYVKQAKEFLPKVFALYPLCKFCLLTLPTMSQESPLLESFVVVPKKYIHKETLLVASKKSLLPVQVRRAKSSDLEHLYNLIDGLAEEEVMIHALQKWTDSIAESPFYTVTAAHDGAVIGAIQLAEEADPDAFITQFDLESVVLTTRDSLIHARLINQFVLDPSFTGQLKWIIQQLFHMTRTPLICSYLQPNQKTCASLLTKMSMFPILPHRAVEYKDNLKQGQPVADPIKSALFAIAPDMTYEPRIRQSSNIVVVGNSMSASGFCEVFATHPYLYFSNINVLASGNSTAAELGEYSNVLLNTLSYWPNEQIQLGTGDFVNIIEEQLMRINRTEKYIETDKGTIIPYDFLVLASGQQFYPSEISPEFENLFNVVGINNGSEKHVIRSFDFLIHHKLYSVDNPDKPFVVVYGRDLQAFPLVNYLTKRGIQPSAIKIVRPLGSSNSLFTESEYCDKKLIELTSMLGVEVINADIVDWSIQGSELRSITISETSDQKSGSGGKTIQCAYLYYCDVKSINKKIFKAINDASLVFDEQLIVDHNFKTHDPFIYACGSLTKYTSKYKTKWKQSYYDSREVGNYLGHVLMQLFDPQPYFQIESSKTATEIPKFKECKRVVATCPDNYVFFRLDKPHLPNDVLDMRKKQTGNAVYGRVLETTTSRGYLQIHVMPNTRIRSITYMGKDRSFSPSNFISLYNLPLACCNNLIERFDSGSVGDLVEFFQGNWAYALFDYRFKSMFDSITMNLMSDQSNSDLQMLIGELKAINLAAAPNSKEQKDILYKKFDEHKGRAKIDEFVWEALGQFLF